MNLNKTIKGIILDESISINQTHEILGKYSYPCSDKDAWKIIDEALAVYKDNLLERLDLGNKVIEG